MIWVYFTESREICLWVYVTIEKSSLRWQNAIGESGILALCRGIQLSKGVLGETQIQALFGVATNATMLRLIKLSQPLPLAFFPLRMAVWSYHVTEQYLEFCYALLPSSIDKRRQLHHHNPGILKEEETEPELSWAGAWARARARAWDRASSGARDPALFLLPLALEAFSFSANPVLDCPQLPWQTPPTAPPYFSPVIWVILIRSLCINHS